ncbi:lantibiotic dehydratase [Streptomyces sp. NBC_01262]|uniref:lantibiotic dehydratase n=1 Tax=Streptomyces sp. NBC_01262 TaxID=2903803 RepID=UPI002E31D89F|nr:lantibiotic dehydratase [Streptomyces sp. NBC_01262]
MRSSDRPAGFRSAGRALIRAVPHAELDLPPWPDLTDPGPEHVASWVEWLRGVWAVDEIAEALSHASPELARQVRTVCTTDRPALRETWRTVMSVARYTRRMAGRPTPFGLLAGVAPAAFGAQPHTHWGTEHRAIAQAGAEWLAEVIAQLERCPDLLARLPVVTNSTMSVRGNHLIVPYQPQARPGRETAAVDASLGYTAAVRAAVEGARGPIPFEELAAKLQAEFPDAAPTRIITMLTGLVACRALITSLHAPATEPDALGYLLEQLRAADAASAERVAGLVGVLEEISADLERHNRAPAVDVGAVREEVTARMRHLAQTKRHPLAVDLRLEATVVLPDEVAREVERAALVLTRLSHAPYGTRAWKAYHMRFYERFGIGSMVPLMDVVADSGIGFPDGYPGMTTPEPGSPMTSRDEALLVLAQRAALDGRDEVVLDEALLTKLDLGEKGMRLPPDMEMCLRVHAASQELLERGDFSLEVVSVARSAGVLTGRFLSVLELEERTALAAALSDLPGPDGDTVVTQLSFPPLDPAAAHVSRAVQVLPTVITLAEHRSRSEQVLTVEDLAVGCDGRRLYLADPVRGHRVDAVGMNALNPIHHTPPLARFLTEISRAQCAQVTAFDWRAAHHLPFLPRLRYGRTILSPATWRLEAAELPDWADHWAVWDDALAAWQAGRRVPRLVYLTQGDRRLLLDLDVDGHRVLLRAHLRSASQAVLEEAPVPEDSGWCGGRPHEVIVPMTATAPPPWPRLPQPTPARIIGRNQGKTPATSRVLLASLYGHIDRQNTILTEHLPGLLAQFEQPPSWWYVRFRDPDHHLRLRIALPEVSAFGEVARTVSIWADELHQAGLLREVRYPTSYPETGRWGSGPAWDAAEEVFRRDSQALLIQLGLPELQRPHRQALVVANTVAIAIAFTGSTAAGMQWLLDHVPATAPSPVPRPVFDEARRIADPRDDWAALRAAPGGAAVADAWAGRDQALADYSTHLPGPDTAGVDRDDALGSLLHTHFVREVGIDFDDEAACLYLARAAALAWTARTAGGRR